MKLAKLVKATATMLVTETHALRDDDVDKCIRGKIIRNIYLSYRLKTVEMNLKRHCLNSSKQNKKNHVYNLYLLSKVGLFDYLTNQIIF